MPKTAAIDPAVLSDRPILVHSEDALSLSLMPSEDMKFLLAGDEHTPDVIDAIVPPGFGPPRHRHEWASYEVVIEGQITAEISGTVYELGPGDFLYTPPNAPHTFINSGEVPARVVGMNLPGGFHTLYEAFIDLAAASGGVPDNQSMAEAARRHKAELLGPPMRIS